RDSDATRTAREGGLEGRKRLLGVAARGGCEDERARIDVRGQAIAADDLDRDAGAGFEGERPQQRAADAGAAHAQHADMLGAGEGWRQVEGRGGGPRLLDLLW